MIRGAAGFELRRDQVVSVSCKQIGIPLIVGPGMRIRIYWADAYGQTNAFTLSRRVGPTRLARHRKNRALAQSLERWRQDGTVPTRGNESPGTEPERTAC